MKSINRATSKASIHTLVTNKSIFRYSSLLFLLISLLFIKPTDADVSISKPLKSTSYSASSGAASIPIYWIESNAVPKLSTITSYTFVLCSGPNSDVDAVKTLEKVSADDISDNTYTASIDASYGADGSYYIQIYAVAEAGYTIHYTNRFTLTDMSGDYEPSGSDASPPDAQTSISGSGTAVSIDTKSFTLAYLAQTGSTRYAPMQNQPGSTVTKAKTAWQRQYATSAVTYFTTIKNSLEQISTITQGWSYTVSSAVNWASVAAGPTSWYAASVRLTRSPTTYNPSTINYNGVSSSTVASNTVTSSA